MNNNGKLLEKLKDLNKKLKIDSETRGVNYYTKQIEHLFNENLEKIAFDDCLIEGYKKIRQLKNYDEDELYIAKEMFKLLVLADVEINEDLILIADMVYLEEHRSDEKHQKIKKTRRF